MASEQFDDKGLYRLYTGLHKNLAHHSFAANYLRSINSWISARGYGFYELDASKKPQMVQAVGVSGKFLDKYEIVRETDPLLSRILKRRRPSFLNLDRNSKKLTSDFLVTFFDEKLGSYMLGPVISEGVVVGTLNFARAHGDTPFGQSDLQKLNLACRMVSQAYQECLAFEKLQNETERLYQILDGAPCAIYVTGNGDDEKVLYANQQAAKLSVGVASAGVVSGCPHNMHTGGDISVRSVKLDDVWVHYVAARGEVKWSAEANLLLTAREKEVLRYTAGGYDSGKIAAALCISAHTVKQHFRNLFIKFDVHSKAELLARVLNTTGGASEPLSTYTFQS